MRKLALLLAPLLAPSHSLRVADTTYEHLGIVCDVICVGRVASVTPIAGERRKHPVTGDEVDPIAIAKLQIREMWKGAADLREVFFVGSKTWTCDITGVEAGQTVLLLLDRWSDQRLADSVWAPELRKLLGKSPFYSVAWAGRGQLKIEADADGRPAGSESVDLYWLPWTGRHKYVALSELRATTRNLLAANALGTVKHPGDGRAALAAVLRQEILAPGQVRTSVVGAVFALGVGPEVYWSVAMAGAGPPFRCGELREWEERRSIDDLRDLPGAAAFRVPLPSLGSFTRARELIVTRDPLFTMTRPGVPFQDGAAAPTGPGAAELVLWDLMRRTILSVRPKEARDAGDAQLELGG